jgi:hypothetical protein
MHTLLSTVDFLSKQQARILWDLNFRAQSDGAKWSCLDSWVDLERDKARVMAQIAQES